VGAAFAATGGVLVIDPEGGVFSALRSANLGVALWRITSRVKPADIVDIGLAVVATNGSPDWGAVAEVADCVPTVVISTKTRPLKHLPSALSDMSRQHMNRTRSVGRSAEP
jgi:hypothetical protein